VQAKLVPSTTLKVLQEQMMADVVPGSELYTDDLQPCGALMGATFTKW
jgi:hypothetical protein